MSTRLRNYTKALYGFDAVIQRVPPDRWDADSPCEGWSARDVVIHAGGVMQAVEAMARTGENVPPATPDPVDDVVALWNTSRDDLLEAVDHPDVLMWVGNYWFGEGTIDDILAFSVGDQLGHSSDVAEAVGRDAHASDDVADASFAVIWDNADMLPVPRAHRTQSEPLSATFLELVGSNPASASSPPCPSEFRPRGGAPSGSDNGGAPTPPCRLGFGVARQGGAPFGDHIRTR